MRLFDETESIYYELISYLLLQKQSFTGSDVDMLLMELSHGEKDFQTLETLFSTQEGQEVLFMHEGGRFRPLIENGIPVRCNGIEQQAFRSLYYLPYAERFLGRETLFKIRDLEKDGKGSLSANKIEIRSRHDVDKAGNRTPNGEDEEKIMIIADAIEQKRSIVYDNILEGAYDYRKAEAFPVKIEYSVLQDVFRVSAYEPVQNRFFMMTLDTMHRVSPGTNAKEDLPALYEAFLQKNKRKVLLDVEPTGHVIERCFRIFSFYERKAVYEREADRYSLEITYHTYDEAELIRDILSLGSSVVVMEPERLRKIVFNRIIAAGRVFA